MTRARLHGARWSPARRGELRRKIPAGYVWDEKGRIVKDPDGRVRTAFDTFFRRFNEVGSACGLASRYDSDGLLFLTREFRGLWDGRVEWRPWTVRHANGILHNPLYAGAYCYGKRRSVTQLDPETKSRKSVSQRKPLDSIEVEAVRPLSIEAALAAIDELKRRSQEIRKQWGQRVEQAEYEASLARRRYEQVDAANRLVTANLEREWEDRLRDLEALRKEYAARAQKPPMRITEEDRARLRELSRDLPRLWR